ncbi:alpha/beta-hydrolase, partial [Hysterangium stoloniferum]
VYEDLVFYFKYASSSYSVFCPNPNGHVLVHSVSDEMPKAQGFLARDDGRREFVLALRGSLSLMNVITDMGLLLVPFKSHGVDTPSGTLVHSGFLIAWNSIVNDVVFSLEQQLDRHPSYSLVITGHSMGGALASLAAMSIRANYPFLNTTLYTYGQPRTGNDAYSLWVNSELGEHSFRVVHTNDGVPTVTDRTYRHHGIEYWQNPDPPSANTTTRCNADGEDDSCSSSIPSTGINPAHMSYFNIPAIRPFCW